MVQNLSYDDVKSFCEETGVFFAIFIKKNGEEREFFGTVDFANIPDEHLPKNDGKSKKKPEGMIVAFDLIKQAWRSFYADSVIYIESLPAEMGLEVYKERMTE